MGLIDNFLSKRTNRNNPEAEMAFTDHIEELRWHILRSLIAIIIGTIFAFINISFIFEHIIMGPANANFISYKLFCKLGELIHVDVLCLEPIQVEFINTQLAGQFMLSFSSSFLIGFVIAFPYVFWEFWRFLKPALKIEEVKAAKGIVFWTSLLFFLGIGFAYFIIAPFTINFFAGYTLSSMFENKITINNYYDTMNDLIIGLGIVFELPVIVYFLSKIGILTPALMREKRRYAIVIIMLISAVITPPDWFSIFLVAIPLTLLYEASIVISARIQKKNNKEVADLDW